MSFDETPRLGQDGNGRKKAEPKFSYSAHYTESLSIGPDLCNAICATIEALHTKFDDASTPTDIARLHNQGYQRADGTAWPGIPKPDWIDAWHVNNMLNWCQMERVTVILDDDMVAATKGRPEPLWWQRRDEADQKPLTRKNDIPRAKPNTVVIAETGIKQLDRMNAHIVDSIREQHGNSRSNRHIVQAEEGLLKVSYSADMQAMQIDALHSAESHAMTYKELSEAHHEKFKLLQRQSKGRNGNGTGTGTELE